MVHCGYDPSGALGTNYQRGDNWKNFKYNFWPRPARYQRGHEVNAFNGVSVGKGHLAPAQAALKSAGLTREGADTEFYVQQMQASSEAPAAPAAHGGGCNGDTSQRDELLAKVRDPNKTEARPE